MITWLIMLLTPGFLIRNYEGVYEWYYKHTVWKPFAKELKKLNEREEKTMNVFKYKLNFFLELYKEELICKNKKHIQEIETILQIRHVIEKGSI